MSESDVTTPAKNYFHVRAAFHPDEPESDYLFTLNQLNVARARALEHPEYVPLAKPTRKWWQRWFSWVVS
jgi:hypothetical protein